MATIPDSIKSTLDAGWTGAGGAEPTYYVKEDYNTYNLPPAGKDYIWIDTTSLKSPPTRVNDTYVNITNTIDVYVNTLTSADRRKEIADEVARILNCTAITGVNIQWVSDRTPVRPATIRGQHMEKIQVTMLELMVSSASAYGAGATGDFIVTGDVYSSTSYSHEEALMLGSANAAWVPGTWAGTTVAGTVITEGAHYKNADANAALWLFQLSLPLVKGGLKLYTDGFKLIVIDAAAADYVTRIFYQGEHTQATTITYFDTTTTDRTAAGDYTYTIAATDLSSFDYVGVQIQTFVTNVGGLDIGPPLFHVWYA